MKCGIKVKLYLAVARKTVSKSEKKCNDAMKSNTVLLLLRDSLDMQ